MSNSASKKQCSLKRQMKQFKEELPSPSYADLCANPDFAEYNKASNTFCRGPARHGNNRHSRAKEKVVERRIDRRRNNRSINKQLRDEE